MLVLLSFGRSQQLQTDVDVLMRSSADAHPGI